MDPETNSFLPEDSEEIVHIETIEDSAQDLALTDTVVKAKDGGVETIPSDMGKLESIDDDHKSNKDSGEIGMDKLDEEEGMTDKIESFLHISLAGEHFRSITKKIANCFNYRPCAKCSGGSSLICKLEIIKVKSISKQFYYHPVKRLQQETANSQRPIVLA